MEMEEEKTVELKEEKKDQKISVKVIQFQGQAAIVEWNDVGRVVRSIVPQVEVKDNSVYMKTLLAAPLYGLDITEIDTSGITPIFVEEIFHKHDLWTSQEILRDRPKLLGVLDEIKQAYLHAIIKLAKEH